MDKEQVAENHAQGPKDRKRATKMVSFQEAYQAALARPTARGTPRPTSYKLEGTDLCAVELSDCLRADVVASWAKFWIAAARGTYIDRNMSAGLTLIGTSTMAPRLWQSPDRRVTIKLRVLHVSVTWRAYAGSPASLAPLDALVSQLLRAHNADD